MITRTKKIPENKQISLLKTETLQQHSSASSSIPFRDNRPETVAQRKLQKIADNQLSVQPIQKQKNNTGLPYNLKSGIENLSGYSMDDVKVHRNSAKPAQLQAHAYAQGTDIHLAPGQEKHLPHEAWHVVQQKQGRVKPTLQMKGKVNINDDAGLEKEADAMGSKALQMQSKHSKGCGCSSCSNTNTDKAILQTKLVIQRYCGVPGCQNPKCNDPQNHNISHFRRLRNVDIYNAERDKSDLGKGSGTNQKTRDYVQDPNSFYPEEVSLSYTNGDGSYQGSSSYIQPPRTPGMKPDAGHIFGNQYGGSGKDTANIFAQEPKHNRGNSYQGERTFEKWRQTENQIRKGITEGNHMKITGKLYREKRSKYDPSTISDEDYHEFMKHWYYRKRDDDHDKDGDEIMG